MLDHMSQQMEALQTLFLQSDISRAMVDERIGELVTSVDRMVNKMEGDAALTGVLTRVAEGQERLVATLEGREADGGDYVDAESRMRLRSIDVQLLRILEEISAGRQESLTEIRREIANITRSLRDLNAPEG